MSSAASTRYEVYPLRFLIQICCCLVAFTVPLQWLSYVPVNQQLRTFYCKDKNDTSCDPAFDTNQIFQGVGLLTGIPGMYITDQYGIRVSVWAAVLTNLLGSVLRVISSIPAINGVTTRVTLLYTGTIIVSISQSFFLVLPCKIANVWFHEDRRARANVLVFVSTGIGEVVGTLIPSLFFDSTKAAEFDRHSYKFMIFNSIMCGICVIPFALAFFIDRSSPPTPPSASNTGQKLAPSFWKGMRGCLKNIQFQVQMAIFGLYFALLWGIMVVLPDMLTAVGYNLSGYPIVAAASAGAIFALVAADIADRTKKFTEIMKISGIAFFLSAVTLRLYFLRTSIYSLDYVAILTICALLGGFSTITLPIGQELGVETTFPIREATSSGLLILSLQLWMFIFYFLFEYIKKINIFYDFKENSIEGNYRLVLDVWIFIAFLMAIFTFVCLRPKYNRISYEQEVRENATTIAIDKNFFAKSEEPTPDGPKISDRT